MPTGLVEKNGSKICCRLGSGMPMPVSANQAVTVMFTMSSRVRTLISPPPGMAPEALCKRFIHTCFSFSGAP